jgi:hypothetical protein
MMSISSPSSKQFKKYPTKPDSIEIGILRRESRNTRDLKILSPENIREYFYIHMVDHQSKGVLTALYEENQSSAKLERLKDAVDARTVGSKTLSASQKRQLQCLEIKEEKLEDFIRTTKLTFGENEITKLRSPKIKLDENVYSNYEELIRDLAFNLCYHFYCNIDGKLRDRIHEERGKENPTSSFAGITFVDDDDAPEVLAFSKEAKKAKNPKSSDLRKRPHSESNKNDAPAPRKKRA